ncbi:hypothetical protein FOA22_25100 [Heyndrickxia oleronia]|uniref:hypothetical protein n=1 Tax=Heyndrickxia oleronia TaxID=38875 RepID=UPI003338EF9C
MAKYTLTFSFFFLMLIYSPSISASTIHSNQQPINFQIELLHWKDVNQIIPKNSVFTVIDVETGKSFDVQRRAGSHHADVQPLTRKDTKVMKEIYHGHWSWRRRAILILAENRLLAASMHGMPHGAGALANGFPGHFCIHFAGSTTHRTERTDLSHQLMIMKAAGKIDDYLAGANPFQVADALLVFIKNGDKGLIHKVVLTEKKNLNKQINKIDKIETLRWNRKDSIEDGANDLTITVPVELQLYIKESGRVNTKISFQLVRTSPLSPWKINIDDLISIINETQKEEKKK